MESSEGAVADAASGLPKTKHRRMRSKRVTAWDASWPAEPDHAGSDGEKGGNSDTSEDEDFAGEARLERLAQELKGLPVSTLYPEIAAAGLEAFRRWRPRFMDRPSLWARFVKHKRKQTRSLKELNESAPVICEVLQIIKETELKEGEKFTIVDLCSGFGFMSMFLAEMLPPELINRIVLVDKMWPMRNQTEAGPTQITWDHIYDAGWKIRMETRKHDIKTKKAWHQMDQYVFRRNCGPIMLLGVHLCGTLSIHAVRAFNVFKNMSLLVLKPCCLPGKIHLHQTKTNPWRIGEHVFNARDVYYSVKGTRLRDRQLVWTQHLLDGIRDTPHVALPSSAAAQPSAAADVPSPEMVTPGQRSEDAVDADGRAESKDYIQDGDQTEAGASEKCAGVDSEAVANLLEPGAAGEEIKGYEEGQGMLYGAPFDADCTVHKSLRFITVQEKHVLNHFIVARRLYLSTAPSDSLPLSSPPSALVPHVSPDTSLAA